MPLSGKNILDHIDRIRAKGDQRRKNRITDARSGESSIYSKGAQSKSFSKEVVQRFSHTYIGKQEKRK